MRALRHGAELQVTIRSERRRTRERLVESHPGKALLQMVQPVDAPVPLAFEPEHAAEVMAEFPALRCAALQGALRFPRRGDTMPLDEAVDGGGVTREEGVARFHRQVRELALAQCGSEQRIHARDFALFRACCIGGKLDAILARTLLACRIREPPLRLAG